MLGLVVGPGVISGVGLVVLGASVPMPPALLPSDEPPSDVPLPDMPDEDGSPVAPGTVVSG